MQIQNQAIESFNISSEGYYPFLIRNGWQLAQLNYTPAQAIDQITRLDIHHQTDEVFVALTGKAVLIAASIIAGVPHFELEYLQHNKIYNIPKKVWHNIAMEPGSKVLIAEKSNTHVSDFEFFDLSSEKQQELKEKVTQLIQTNHETSKPLNQ
ncbi:MAG: hypothetical protein AAF985_14405 [Bacteroidota bacterium]